MTPKPITQNTLVYGDNLPILREYVPGESIDLVYLGPPFNSKPTNDKGRTTPLVRLGGE